MMANYISENSSFRDPSGFLFYYEHSLYRQINKSYSEHYEHLMKSGLYDSLIKENLLIPHEEVDVYVPLKEKHYKTIQPKLIPFISYPYEWSFSQLKDAALLTLKIQKIAMKFDMILKDASVYNVQFLDGKPIFIDSLSFEKYEEGKPWKAYKQFCQHFLAPIALMSHKDIRLNQLFKLYVDGIPLDLVSKLLPLKTRSMFSLLTHIHGHAKSQKHYEHKKIDLKKNRLSKRSFEGIIESLNSGISKSKWSFEDTEWGNYYLNTNYSDPAFKHKMDLVEQFIQNIKPKNVWDLGANTGIFSRISSKIGIHTVAFDIDPVAVEKNYLECKKNEEKNILPLILDLTNPSPDIGWENKERKSFLDRGPVDLVLALALVHHLAISNNLPLEMISEFFKKICNFLIIEFIPKSDSQVQRLLTTREDIFNDYNRNFFESKFKENFEILESINVNDSERVIYLMKRL
jgi:hypothetical protein